MNIAIVIPACEKYDELWNFTLSNRLEYCLKHGYDLLRARRKLNGSVPFGKIEFVRDILKDYDWVWLLGADTLHMNMTIPATEFIDEKYDVIIGEDVHGINCDSVLFKNSEWTREYLNYILSQFDRYKNHEWQEQQCMIESKDSRRDHIKIIPQKSFNSYVYEWYRKYNQPGEFSDGDAILHFVGMQNHERLARMKDYMGRIQR